MASDPSPFDPAAHRFGPARYFEDMKVGEQFYLPSRTLTEANFAAFQTVSGDNHPIHYDVEYCRRHGHPGLLAHGFQVLAQTAAGAGIFPHVVGESLIGFIEQSSRFLKPAGWILFEHGWKQGPFVRSLLEQHGYTNVVSRLDLAGHERVTEGQRGDN